MDSSGLVMKTGYDLIGTENTDHDEMLLNVMSTMGILMEQALKSAEMYTKHSKREVITGKDIIIALQYQAHVFFNLPGVKEDCLALKEELINELDESDGEESDGEESEGEEEEVEELWTRSKCECGRCRAMNMFHDNWKEWNPPDGSFEASIKKSIDSTIDKFES